MNYRHIYHAGNFADVFKHIVLMLCLEYLGKKDKPYFALDTHAGIGRYDLASEQAQKTGEAALGVQRLWSVGRSHAEDGAPEIVKRYLALLKTFNRGQALRVYPGSPSFMKEMLRQGDRMVANELHPEDVRTLRQALGGDDRVKVEQMDAYQIWKASVPPLERRGIVLVDPPFEVRNEFELMAQGLKDAHKRWATGVYALWYPIKDVAAIKGFHGAVKDLGIPDCRAMDFYLGDTGEEGGLIGCGLVMVNAPYTLVSDMQSVMPFLIEQLTGGRGRFEAAEITPEKL